MCVTGVVVSSHINSEETGAAVQRFCGEWLYLGVMVDSDEAIAEIDEDNNYAWASVFLNCPGITGNSFMLLYCSPLCQQTAISKH